MISDVGIIVDSRTTSVEFDFTLMKRMKSFDLFTQSIIKFDHERILLRFSKLPSTIY
jgi:hypothetical protein